MDKSLMNKEVTDEIITEQIASISPEGRPADPHLGPRRTKLLLLGVLAAIILIGAVVAFAVQPALGIGMALVGSIVYLGQPSVMAALFRAEERKDVPGVEPAKPEASKPEQAR